MMRRLGWLPLFLAAGPAYAHAPVPGIKGFYLGLLHPFSTPPQALLMLGLAFLVGSFTIERVRWLFGFFALSVFLGLFTEFPALNIDVAMYAVAVVACILAALSPGKVPVFAIAVLSVGGLLVGSASIPDGGILRDRIFTISGSVIGANVGLLYLWGAAHFIQDRFRWTWVLIGFRVVSAWIGAVALLMLALAVNGMSGVS